MGRRTEVDPMVQGDAEGHGASEQREPNRSIKIASQGISTASQFASLMSAMMTEVLSGQITPGVCNAAVNAGGKLLKVVEMQQRYGVNGDNSSKDLQLCPPSPDTDPRARRLAELEHEIARLKGD